MFRLVIAEGAQVRTNEFRDGDYAAVSMDGPELDLAREGEEQVLRVLDLGAAEVVERTYRWAKTEGDCRVVDFSDRNKTARRWVCLSNRAFSLGAAAWFAMAVSRLRSSLVKSGWSTSFVAVIVPKIRSR